MDAKTRHELKQNELAEALAKLRQFDSPSTRYTLLAVVVVLAAIGGWKLWGYSRQHALEQEWQSLASIQTALSQADPAQASEARSQLQQLIDDADSAELAGYATLRLAQLQIDRAVEQPGQRQVALEEAVALLQELARSSEASPALVAAAAHALGKTHESLRQVDEARAAYQSVVDNEARFAGSPFITLCGAALEQLDTLEVAIAFAPGDPPALPTPPRPAGSPIQGFSDLEGPTNISLEELRRRGIDLPIGEVTTKRPPTADAPKDDQSADPKPETPSDKPAEKPVGATDTPAKPSDQSP